MILAVLTAFAYLFHYFFEFGYLSYFDIPTAFISFNLPEMIPAITFLVVTYLLLVFVLWPLLRALLAVLPGVLKVILIVLPWVVIFVLSGFSWITMLLLLAGMLVIFAINRFSGRVTGSDAWGSRLLPAGNRLWWLYLLLTALALSYALGRTAAVTRGTFPVSDAPQRCAVVYTTANLVICKPLNERNEFERTFIIFNISQTESIQFRDEDLGPLRPQP